MKGSSEVDFSPVYQSYSLKFLTTWDIRLFEAIPAMVPAPSAPYKNILSHFEGHFLYLCGQWILSLILYNVYDVLTRPRATAKTFSPKQFCQKQRKLEKKFWVLRFSRSFDHSALGWTNIFDTKISSSRFHYPQK